MNAAPPILQHSNHGEVETSGPQMGPNRTPGRDCELASLIRLLQAYFMLFVFSTMTWAWWWWPSGWGYPVSSCLGWGPNRQAHHPFPFLSSLVDYSPRISRKIDNEQDFNFMFIVVQGLGRSIDNNPHPKTLRLIF